MEISNSAEGNLVNGDSFEQIQDDVLLPKSIGSNAVKTIGNILHLKEYNVIIAASWDSKVRVYRNEFNYDQIVEFRKHTSDVNSICSVQDDVVATVDSNGGLFTWSATTGHVVGSYIEESCWMDSVGKINANTIATGTSNGSVIFFSHNRGKILRVKTRYDSVHSNLVYNIVSFGDTAISVSRDCYAVLWDTKSTKPRFKLNHRDSVRSASINSKHIVTGCSNGIVYVWSNDHNLKLLSKFVCNYGRVNCIEIINEDTLMVVHSLKNSYSSLSFISLSKKSVVHRKVSDKRTDLWTARLVSPSFIAVGGRKGQFSLTALVDFPVSLSDSLSIISASYKHSSALEHAFHKVQTGEISCSEACELITEKNTNDSLKEWIFGHLILMEALEREEIPTDKDYNGIPSYWYKVLYKQGAKIAKNDMELTYVIQLIHEGETVGILSPGVVDIAYTRFDIKNDSEFLKNDLKKLSHAVWELFLRQAEMDDQVRIIFKTQQKFLEIEKKKKFITLVSAILSCLPLAGGVIAHSINATATVMDGFEVTALVESLVSLGKDLSSPLVEKFLEATNKVLDQENFDKFPDEKKQMIIDAARSIGISVEELRENIKSWDRKNTNELVLEETSNDLESEIPKELVRRVRMPRNDNHKIMGFIEYIQHKILLFRAMIFQDMNVEKQKETELIISLQETTSLSYWKDKHVSNSFISRLKMQDLNAFIAAYLVNFEEYLANEFSLLRNAFQDNLKLSGSTVARANNREKEEIRRIIEDQISFLFERDDQIGLRINLRTFLENVGSGKRFLLF